MITQPINKHYVRGARVRDLSLSNLGLGTIICDSPLTYLLVNFDTGSICRRTEKELRLTGGMYEFQVPTYKEHFANIERMPGRPTINSKLTQGRLIGAGEEQTPLLREKYYRKEPVTK